MSISSSPTIKSTCIDVDESSSHEYVIVPSSWLRRIRKLCRECPSKKLFSFVREELGQDEYNCCMEETVVNYMLQGLEIPNELNTWSLSDIPAVSIKWWMEVWILDEDDFWKTFHVSKHTLHFIMENIKTESLKMDESSDAGTFEVYVIKTILLCLWYLRNDEPITVCSDVFCVSLENIDDELAKGFALINEINVPILSDKSLQDTRNYYIEKAHMPMVGVIGFQAFKGEDNQEVMAQFICNQNFEFLAFDAFHHTKLCQGLIESKRLQKVLRLVPEDSFIAGFKEYEKFPQFGNFLKIITPILNEESREYETFNQGLSNAFVSVQGSLLKLIKRFPRLCNMHKRMSDGILAAFTLYNICCFKNDQVTPI